MRSQPSVRSSSRRPIARHRAWLAVALLLAGAPGAAVAQRAAHAPSDARRAAPTAGAPAPDPRLAPESVIGIVLEAFAHVEGTAHAPATLETAYAFTAPANRAVFGSVERFSDVLTDVAYRPLLGHRRSVRGALKVEGDRATQRVVVTSATGALVVYTFTLTRQGEGEYVGCWMTERVKREPPSSLAAPLLT
jgi:hypothetical protein